MDPAVFKKESRRKENITPSTFVAPKPTPAHYFLSKSIVFTHMPRASQGPWDSPEDTWIFVGTNADLQLSTRRGREQKGQAQQILDAVGVGTKHQPMQWRWVRKHRQV